MSLNFVDGLQLIVFEMEVNEPCVGLGVGCDDVVLGNFFFLHHHHFLYIFQFFLVFVVLFVSCVFLC